MNERVSAAAGQVKQAFTKLRDNWREQEPARKKLIISVGIGLIVLALGLVVFLNLSAARYVVLYKGMTRDESVKAAGVLTDKGIVSRINDQGELEVPNNKADLAMGQLAMQGIPSSTLDYAILEKAGGLTTTDSEKTAYKIAQTQDRLQSIIRTFDDVENAFVTLNLNQSSNRVWDTELERNSAAVKLNVLPGGKITAGQVSGIRFLVGDSTGIDPENVSVIDGSGNVLAAAGQSNDMSSAGAQDFLQRLDFEEAVEKRLVKKAENILAMKYPDTAMYSISATAKLDWDAMMTESMQYAPLDETDHGVTNKEEIRAQMGTGQYTEGVVGETDNTDVPTYADLDGDGEMDAVDYYRNREYLLSYVKQQVEKDGAKLAEASIAVMLQGSPSNEERQSLRESIAMATNVPMERISVQSVLGTGTGEGGEDTRTGPILGLPPLFIYIAVGILVVGLLALIVISMLRRKKKKKLEAALLAEQQAEQEEAERIQREIEERKLQLKKAAIGDQSENAITEEVREFAKANPEITANLLRNWLKEGE